MYINAKNDLLQSNYKYIPKLRDHITFISTSQKLGQWMMCVNRSKYWTKVLQLKNCIPVSVLNTLYCDRIASYITSIHITTQESHYFKSKLFRELSIPLGTLWTYLEPGDSTVWCYIQLINCTASFLDILQLLFKGYYRNYDYGTLTTEIRLVVSLYLVFWLLVEAPFLSEIQFYSWFTKRRFGPPSRFLV